MSALIMRQGTILSDYNNTITDFNFDNYDVPADYLAYVISRSNQAVDNDGYGVLYYPQGSYLLTSDNYWYKYVHTVYEVNQVYYTGNHFNPNNQADVFDSALDKIAQPESKAGIVMLHARNATSNPFAPGNHPFRLNANNRTYTFMHNGFVDSNTRSLMINETNAINSNWFQTHTPNYTDFGNAAYPVCWIDSEVIFHYLMCHIEAYNYDVYTGMQNALRKLTISMQLSTNVVNFVLSDGQQLYAFRSTALVGTNSNYKLSYKPSPTGFCGIRTGVPSATETEIKTNELVIATSLGKVECHPAYLESFNGFTNRLVLSQQGQISRSIVNSNNISNSGVTISFSLNAPARIVVNIYNQKGQFVRRLKNEQMDTGTYKLNWNGTDNRGRYVAKGIYFLEMKKDRQRVVSKINYLK